MAASSCEAEHCSYSSAVKDLEYVRVLFRDLFIFPDDEPALTMLVLIVNSEPAMAIYQGPTHRSRTKHIDFIKALNFGDNLSHHGRAMVDSWCVVCSLTVARRKELSNFSSVNLVSNGFSCTTRIALFGGLANIYS